jgi:hypothetical protein
MALPKVFALASRLTHLHTLHLRLEGMRCDTMDAYVDQLFKTAPMYPALRRLHISDPYQTDSCKVALLWTRSFLRRISTHLVSLQCNFIYLPDEETKFKALKRFEGWHTPPASLNVFHLPSIMPNLKSLKGHIRTRDRCDFNITGAHPRDCSFQDLEEADLWLLHGAGNNIDSVIRSLFQYTGIHRKLRQVTILWDQLIGRKLQWMDCHEKNFPDKFAAEIEVALMAIRTAFESSTDPIVKSILLNLRVRHHGRETWDLLSLSLNCTSTDAFQWLITQRSCLDVSTVIMPAACHAANCGDYGRCRELLECVTLSAIELPPKEQRLDFGDRHTEELFSHILDAYSDPTAIDAALQLLKSPLPITREQWCELMEFAHEDPVTERRRAVAKLLSM